METEAIILIVVAGLLCLALIGWAIYSILNTRWKGIVFESSERLKGIREINSHCQFKACDNTMSFCTLCKSKRAFDRFDYLARLKEYLIEHQGTIQEKLSRVRFNNEKYNEYLEKVRSCISKMTEEECKPLHISYARYLSVEEKLFKKQLLNPPVLKISFKVSASYVSPQGRNRYYHSIIYNDQQVARILPIAIQEQQQLTEYQRQILTERSKMGDGLRYDILKRDGFRCQICGASAKDGVKLHVDHIVPVSKGGKTVPSNLRTLCNRCNLGKRDKLE